MGSAHKLPKENEWLVYEEWSAQLGLVYNTIVYAPPADSSRTNVYAGSDVLYFESWGRPNIVINSHEAASELLEKRSALYSDRPRWPMLVEL